jgi:hypothetical protein
MKKYGIFAAVLVLTLALLTGCRKSNAAPTELPPTTGATIVPTTAPTTIPTTIPTTVPPTDMTEDFVPTEHETGATDSTIGARSRMPGVK